MTDSSIGMNAGSDSNLSGNSTVNLEANASENTNTRTFSQNDVNEIVKRAKQEAVDRDRRLRVEQPEYANRKYEDATSNNSATLNDEKIRQIVAQETKREREEAEKQYSARVQQEKAQEIVQKFLHKVDAGKTSYQDFNDVTGDINFGAFPNTVQLLAEYVDNAADLIYEFGKNRFKLAELENLSKMSANDAIKEVQRLSKSIKANKEAANIRLPNEPLSQLRPTTNGTDNGSVRSIGDYKRMFRV